MARAESRDRQRSIHHPLGVGQAGQDVCGGEEIELELEIVELVAGVEQLALEVSNALGRFVPLGRMVDVGGRVASLDVPASPRGFVPSATAPPCGRT